MNTSLRLLALVGVLVLSAASHARAQSPAIDINVIGEYRIASGETPETGRQLAVADARRKAWTAAADHLLRRADLKALRLKPIELEAFAAVTLDIGPSAPATPVGGLARASLRARLDAPAAVRRMASLRTDQDASFDLTEAWMGIRALHQRLDAQSQHRASAPPEQVRAIERERSQTLASLEIAYLAARASAALARTEQSAVGGRAATAEGRQRARELAEAALALSAESADAHAVMGDVFLDALEPERAEEEFRRAIAADGSSNIRRIKLAEALRLQGKVAEAVAELREVIRVDPASARAHNGLGWAMRAERQNAEAVAAYREAIRLDPDLIDAHNGLAVALANQGKLEEAVAEFREIIRIDPDSAIGYYNLAYALADLDRDVESAAALREVIRINPNHYNARFNLGELFRLEAKYDDSARQFREYLRLAPDTPQNRRNIQRAREYVQKFEDPANER